MAYAKRAKKPTAAPPGSVQSAYQGYMKRSEKAPYTQEVRQCVPHATLHHHALLHCTPVLHAAARCMHSAVGGAVSKRAPIASDNPGFVALF